MSRHVIELENLLQQLITEHHRLTGQLEAQQTAMKRIDMRGIDEATRVLETTRLRITGLETKRRVVVMELAKAAKVHGMPRLSELAKLYPQRSANLLKLRADLRAAIETAHRRSYVVGRMSVAVLGHLNAVVRLLSKVVQQAGLYTKNGLPQVGVRLGVMDAKG